MLIGVSSRVAYAADILKSIRLPWGESVDSNMKEIGSLIEEYGTEVATLLWIGRVYDGGRWDYKAWVGENRPERRSYENLGNFNYGATGQKLFTEQTLLRAAGGYGALYGGGYDSSNGGALGGWPYGDKARDQYAIQLGILYGQTRGF